MFRHSVIIPAHNEAGRIERTLKEYAEVFADGEIIVVLNNCTDDTAHALRNVTAACLRAVEITDPIGKGGAVRAGFMLARAPLVGFVDADGSTSAAEMRRLFGLLAHADAAIGSRWMPGASLDPPQPLIRRVASRVFNLLARSLTRLPFSDTQCGAKAFRADALARVLPAVETANFAFDVDLLAALARLGARIVEVPIAWRDRSTSRLRVVRQSLRMAGALARLAMKRSRLHWAVPYFDRIVPTRPLTLHELRAVASNGVILRTIEQDEL
ncbi:MAG: glycosyltransferase [Candidatus Eremiobacteraeota bacterium]|nr:glycosyltransferase [Candidatus Eremiobacteraeota bacterium]MBV8281892.1 glycosyltransferase [Candidatus Eremiobacteraeota bacterium]